MSGIPVRLGSQNTHSHYIIDSEPHKYGGQQNSYIEQSDKIVAKTEKRLAKLSFPEILDVLGSERQKIAQRHKTEDAKLFGVRRDHIYDSCGFVATPLIYPYEKYNQVLVSFFQAQLMNLNFNESQEVKVVGEACLGKQFFLDFLMLNSTNIGNYILSGTYEEYTQICAICNFPVPEEKSFNKGMFNDFLRNFEALRKIKSSSKEIYRKMKLTGALLEIKSLLRIDPEMSDWLVVTFRLEIDKKAYALSQYLIPYVKFFGKIDLSSSLIGIQHQDPFLIEPMIQDIEKIFKKALEWTQQKPIEELKRTMALFQYELAHAMPFSRGSAAISEWIERAMYLHHGYIVEYKPQKMVNLEALTYPLSAFVQNYDSMIALHRSE